MNRIEEKFAALRAKKKSADSLFNSGQSVAERYKTINLCFGKAGTDIVEIGVPFSDPTADGPVIQEASQRA